MLIEIILGKFYPLAVVGVKLRDSSSSLYDLEKNKLVCMMSYIS